MTDQKSRRKFLTRALAIGTPIVLAGCDRISQSKWGASILGVGETLDRAVRRVIGARVAMAQEFTPSDLSPSFRSNGTASPDNAAYKKLAAGHFADYRLVIDGLVESQKTLSLDGLRALASRTQITRHDCVEGWSAIGKWRGARLSAVMQLVKPLPTARFVVFHCADSLDDESGAPYYESIDMDDAYHEQTILAYDLNDAPLPVANGAPIRLRVERQLGYKMAKYVMRIELVDSFASIGEGKGGYWEDQGYQWYAGI